ncbi:hypothetical protein INR49_003461 [Caranx melampygus]|nr:hypothetical protein INR49_003461 [Caranx melampygus]
MLLLLLLLLSGWSQSNWCKKQTSFLQERKSRATTLVVTAVPPAQLCHPHQNTVLSLIATEMIDCTKHSNFELIHLKGELKKEEDESSFQENLTAHRLLIMTSEVRGQVGI